MRLRQAAVEPIGKAGVEVDLDQDGHREHRNHQRLLEDLLALEAEQQHQRRQQREKGHRLQRLAASLQRLRPRANSIARQACATITGTTMYSTTDTSSVSHGTTIEDRPSSSATIGAKANTMMVSLSATWLR